MVFTLFAKFKNEQWKKLIHAVIIPLPIAFLYASYIYDPDNSAIYSGLIWHLIVVSVFIGIGVLVHCIADWKQKGPYFYFRFVPSIILLLNPFLLYEPDAYNLMTALFLFSGILLGIYGYFTYWEGRTVGLIYLYISLLFMVIIPVISVAIMKIYFDHIKDEIIYYRSRSGFVTCHMPAGPASPPIESLQITGFFSTLYVTLFGILTFFRKRNLGKRLQKRGIIPKEFQEIIERREADDNRDIGNQGGSGYE